MEEKLYFFALQKTGFPLGIVFFFFLQVPVLFSFCVDIKKRIFAEGCKSIGFADCDTHLTAKTKQKKEWVLIKIQKIKSGWQEYQSLFYYYNFSYFAFATATATATVAPTIGLLPIPIMPIIST